MVKWWQSLSCQNWAPVGNSDASSLWLRILLQLFWMLWPICCQCRAIDSHKLNYRDLRKGIKSPISAEVTLQKLHNLSLRRKLRPLKKTKLLLLRPQKVQAPCEPPHLIRPHRVCHKFSHLKNEIRKITCLFTQPKPYHSATCAWSGAWCWWCTCMTTKAPPSSPHDPPVQFGHGMAIKPAASTVANCHAPWRKVGKTNARLHRLPNMFHCPWCQSFDRCWCRVRLQCCLHPRLLFMGPAKLQKCLRKASKYS